MFWKKNSTSAFESLDLALRSDIKAVKDTHTTTCYGYERKRAERRESLHVLFSTVWALTTDDTDWCRKVYGVVVLCKLKMNVQGKGNATTEHSSHTANGNTRAWPGQVKPHIKLPMTRRMSVYESHWMGLLLLFIPYTVYLVHGFLVVCGLSSLFLCWCCK